MNLLELTARLEVFNLLLSLALEDTFVHQAGSVQTVAKAAFSQSTVKHIPVLITEFTVRHQQVGPLGEGKQRTANLGLIHVHDLVDHVVVVVGDEVGYHNMNAGRLGVVGQLHRDVIGSDVRLFDLDDLRAHDELLKAVLLEDYVVHVC